MDKNPLAQTTNVEDPQASRRRSTRIDFVTTVLLSGKDSSGTPFREFTQTLAVNLHGCKVRTSYRILVGMLVTVECPKAGTSGKGVCVKVWDPPPGEAGHEIAVQLIKPQNLWGVPNPPSDWELVAKTMVQGRGAQPESPAPAAMPVAPAVPPASPPARLSSTGIFRAPANPPAPAPVPPAAPTPVAPPAAPPARLTTTAVLRAPAISPAVEAVAPPAAPPPRLSSTGVFRAPAIPPAAAPAPPPVAAPVAGPTIEQRLAELERRSTQLMESVLDIMRGQAEELTRNCLEEFRVQVDALMQDAEARLRQGFQQAYEESAASLIGLRTDLMEQMASRGSQMIRTTEDTLRTRLRGQMAVENKSAPAKFPEKIKEK